MRATDALLERWGKRLGQALHFVLVPRDIHNRHTRDLSNASLQVAIARGDNKHAMGRDAVDQAVIGICPFVRTHEPPKPAIPRYSERDGVLLRQLLQFSNNAIRHANGSRGSETVKHGAGDVELVRDGEVDKVGIDEDAEGGPERGIELEEHGGRVGVAGQLGLVRLLVDDGRGGSFGERFHL